MPATGRTGIRANVLQQLEKRFEKLRKSALKNHDGAWTLIEFGGHVDYFDAEQDAITAGYHRGQGAPFLVKQMLSEDRVITTSLVSLR